MSQAWNDIGGLFDRFRTNWRSFFAIHLAVTVLVFVLLAPLATFLLRLVVSLSGDAALSDQDIVFFILSPAGFTAFVVLVSLYSIILFLEYAALIMVGWLVEKGKPAPVLGVLGFLAGHAARLFGLAALILLRVVLYSLPFLAALGLVYLLLLSQYDINFYLADKPAEWYIALTLAGLVAAAWGALMLWLASGWAFCIPLLLLGGLSPGQAIATSVHSCKGRRLDILRAFAGWLIFSLALAALAALLAALVSWLLLPSDIQSLNALLLALGFMSLFGFVESFLVTFVSTSMLCLLILKLFNAFGLSRETNPTVYQGASRVSGFRLSRSKIILGLSAGLLVSLFMVYGITSQFEFESDTQVMAHRGASAAAPENTLAAIQLAIDSGADWVEIDVQQAADGEIVVIHDSDLKKVGGVPTVVAESTVRELKWVDIGSWFDLKFSDERIPTLREVLELCKGKIRINIELKYYGAEKNLEQGVADVVDSLDMAEQVVAMSLSLPGVREMKRLRPEWKVGLLSSVAVGDLARLDVDFLALNARFATRELVRRMHQQGKEVMVWTVNDAVGMSAMASRGVDTIITDEPGLAVKLMEHRKQLDSPQRLLLTLAELFDRPSLVQEQ